MTSLRFLIVLTVTLFISVRYSPEVMAGETETILRAAAQAYTKADYRTAIRLYEQAIHDGASGPDIWYNLGNAYFKDGNLAYSILWFERASAIHPGDEQLHDNLAIANARIRDKVEPIPLLFVVRWWNDLKTTNSLSALFAWSCVFFWLSAAAVFVFFGFRNLLIRRMSLVLGIVFICVGAAAIFLYFDRQEDLDAHRFAIVTTHVVTAKSTPDATGVDSFTLHEGLKLEITETRDSWFRIRLADGKDGWIPSATVERI